MIKETLPGSFRDPSGFLFCREGILFRQVNSTYKVHYDQLMNSGLYAALVDEGLLLVHQEVDVTAARPEISYKVIQPQKVPFISYPYEWSFSQFKDAALTTLKVQKKAFDFGMSLKDCSAYNVQFYQARPVFIDTLSFEAYDEGRPWVAYRQFCQHFLAPLALMSLKDIRLNQLLRVYIDGIPLDLASSLLPAKSRLNFSLLPHIHLHSKSQRHFADKEVDVSGYRMSRLSFCGLIDNLESAVRRLKWEPKGTEWGEYYQDTNYSEQALQHKKQILSRFLDRVKPSVVWDLGANIGVFSRIASDKGIFTISFDNDPVAIEKSYLECAQKKEAALLPLLLDIINPSPGIGWQNQERASFIQRGPADMALALALVHHLAISNNLPFPKIAEFFDAICDTLVVEFVPKDDSQVQRMLRNREDIFDDYHQNCFEQAFGVFFTIKERIKIDDSQRIMYLMQKRQVLL